MSPTQQFANLSVSEPSTNPWQPALDEKAISRKPIPDPPQLAPADHEEEDLIDLEEPESPAWDEDDQSTSDDELPVQEPKPHPQILEDQHARGETHDGRDAIDTNKFLSTEFQRQPSEGWSLIDQDPNTSGEGSGLLTGEGLEPQRDTESSSQHPTHPPTTATSTNTPSFMTPAAKEAAEKQKKETYEIKKVSWHDNNAAQNPRISPILVQNANGPCPLLALVNALTLSTPAEVETALVDTLRSREQVSLGLLLDAVIDELISGRRRDATQELPDVSELYYFLITLHTGMNVNPRFFPLPPTQTSSDPRNSMSHVHPAEREESLPGTFENTREMSLYSTFCVPLIHGWLPSLDSAEYVSLKRSAPSYEDAQNLMFHEEVLEDKLRREGLSFEEQATLEDISTIKAFFTTAATQLTTHGLETITTSLAPGAVAILFRNDHFSTLYRHPNTLQILQLVTDMGYSGHEEVVWESLVDVNGENAEFFSGDFRLVGGAPASPQYSRDPSHSHSQGIPIRNRDQPHHRSASPQRDSLRSPVTEQEDRDLALALQLQEEEEERHRGEVDRRRRETELSQQYIEQQGSQGSQGRSVPVATRGGGRRSPDPPRQPPRPTTSGQRPSTQRSDSPVQRPSIPPRRDTPAQPLGGRPIDPEAGSDAPPPSYEQAATQAAYVPPADHPSHPGSSPSARRTAQNPPPVNAQPARSSQNPRNPNGTSRRKAVGSQAGGQKQSQDKERDCVVM